MPGKRGRPKGARNRTLEEVAESYLNRHSNHAISDPFFWRLFQLWWQGAGHPDEIAIFRSIGDQRYGGEPAKAVRQAIRFILANSLWG